MVVNLRAIAVFASMWAVSATAQEMPVQTFAASGGKSENAEISHFSAVGIGMAVGTATGGGIEVHHGFLAGAQVFSDSDVEAPEFDPQPQNLRFAVRDADCLAEVVFPEYKAVDDRDQNPRITVTIVEPLTDVNPDGETILLPPGIRVDVVDETPPVIDPIPNPTPTLADAVEATSPSGTPVPIDIRCADACDPNPVALDVQPKFLLGSTDVTLTCRDDAGNEQTEDITIHVKDTTPPRLIGDLPDAFNLLCNNAGGATVQVPFVIFGDNASRASQIAISLVVDPDDNLLRQEFAQIPNTVTLGAGRHVLRYLAEDQQGLTAQADLVVQVVDETAPSVTIVGIPESTWFNNNNAEFALTVVDDCGSADQLDIALIPEPDEFVRIGDSNSYSVKYLTDGKYNLQISVTDDGGNITRRNDVSFGVDRTRPTGVFVEPVEPPGGDVEDDETLLTFYGMGERVAMTFGAQDPGGVNASGVQRVTALVPQQDVTLFDVEFNGAGRPVQGDLEVDNLRCDTIQEANGIRFCEDEKVTMKLLPPGVVSIQLEITDFAGNTQYQAVEFVNGNLGAAITNVEKSIRKVLSPCPTCPVLAEGPEVVQMNLALARLEKGVCNAGFKCISNEV